jgi:sec-independent protein translocase protein TatB
MFDFGLGSFELLMIAIVAIIVVGPKDLPKLLRTVGQFMTKVRGLAREFQGYIDEAARETGLDEVKKEVSNMTNFTVTDPSTKPGSVKSAIQESAPKTDTAKTDAPKADAAKDTGSSVARSTAVSPTKKPAAKKPAAKKPSAKKAATKKPAAKKTAKAG